MSLFAKKKKKNLNRVLKANSTWLGIAINFLKIVFLRYLILPIMHAFMQLEREHSRFFNHTNRKILCLHTTLRESTFISRAGLILFGINLYWRKKKKKKTKFYKETMTL